MEIPVTEERISKIERAVQDFITSMKESHLRTESELREFKDDMKQQNREMNIICGEMAKKLGTITEDLVAPNNHRL